MFTDNYAIARYLCAIFYEMNDGFVLLAAFTVILIIALPYILMFRLIKKTLREIKQDISKS